MDPPARRNRRDSLTQRREVMIGAISKYRLDKGHIIEVVQKAQQNLAPLVRRTPGFVGFYTLADGDTIATVLFCSDPQGLREAHETVRNWIGALGASIIQQSQDVLSGEVTVRISS